MATQAPSADRVVIVRRHPAVTAAKWTGIGLLTILLLAAALLVWLNTDPGRRFSIPVQLLFKGGVSRLDARQKEELEMVLPSLRSRKDLVEVVGSCADDEVGTMRDALELSFARARAVSDYLAAHGMPPERLVPSGIGDADFAAVSGESRAQRQRVELRWMLRN